MRTSNNEYKGGRLINGYDYDNQAWVVGGRYVACGHLADMACGCYGRIHVGEKSDIRDIEEWLDYVGFEE